MSARPQLHNVLQHPAIWRAADAHRAAQCRQQGQVTLDTGYPTLDRALPDGGWPTDGVAELLCPHWGCGEADLLAPLLRQLSTQPRWLVWVNPPWIPYAPALAQQGIMLENTLILHGNSDKEILWAMEQCLVSGSCSLVQGWPANPQPQQIRRLQLAAQKGRSLAMLLRPRHCAQQPSPAPLRLELGPLQQDLQVRVVKCRGSWGTGWLRLKPQALSAYVEPLTVPALPAATVAAVPLAEAAPLSPLPLPVPLSQPPTPAPGPHAPGG